MRNDCNFTTLSMRAVLRRARQLLVAFSLCFLATGTPVMAQNLADFKSAAAADGVNVIPFESLRKEAASIALEVDERKKEATSWNYSTYENQKNSLLKKKADKQKEIEDQGKEIEDLKKLENPTGLPTAEGELKELEQELKAIDNDIDNMNDKIEEGAEAWKRYWNARGGLREKFDDALNEVKSAGSNPKKYLDSDSDDATDEDIEKLKMEKLKRYCDIIEDEIEAGAPSHKEQEDGAIATEQKFRELIKKTN